MNKPIDIETAARKKNHFHSLLENEESASR